MSHTVTYWSARWSEELLAKRAVDAICQWQPPLGYERPKGIVEAMKRHGSAPVVRDLCEQA